MSRMSDRISETYRAPLGKYRGLDASLILHPLGSTDVVLDGATHCRETLLRDNPGSRAVLNALERLADSYESQARRTRTDIGVKEGQLRDFESRIGRPFEHLEYQSQLTDLRDQLKLGLSENPPDGLPPVADLAERIKELRAANTVEAAPERVAVRKVIGAEVPVTARIRRKEPVKAIEVEKPAEEPKPVLIQVAEPSKVIALPDLVKPAAGYRHKVAARRERPEQLRLF